MPRYYFHIRRKGVLEKDPEGAVFASLADAEDEAVKAAREMLAEWVLSGEVIDGETFEICGEDGSVLRKVPFRTVLRLE